MNLGDGGEKSVQSRCAVAVSSRLAENRTFGRTDDRKTTTPIDPLRRVIAVPNCTSSEPKQLVPSTASSADKYGNETSAKVVTAFSRRPENMFKTTQQQDVSWVWYLGP